ncbi:interleukin-20 receptor subunit beta isoform 2-T2 [Geothlypis trichas]
MTERSSLTQAGDTEAVRGDALLPAPQSISIVSTNMKHFLTWSPVIVQGATVRYSVEFQGEYEREYANGSWIPISECSFTTATICNLTEDISASVAYKLRVRAELGATRSQWGTTKGFFNRAMSASCLQWHRLGCVLTAGCAQSWVLGIPDPPAAEGRGGRAPFAGGAGRHGTLLPVPGALLEEGPGEQGSLRHQWQGCSLRGDACPDVCVVGLWQVQQKVLKEVSSVVHLDTMEAGAEYCVKAQTHVQAINRSSSFSPTQCVRAQGDRSMWLVTALISSAGFAVAVLTLPLITWKISKIFQYSCCPAAVLPDTLKESEPPTQLILRGSEEAEQCDLMVVVTPSEEVLQLWIQRAL